MRASKRSALAPTSGKLLSLARRAGSHQTDLFLTTKEGAVGWQAWKVYPSSSMLLAPGTWQGNPDSKSERPPGQTPTRRPPAFESGHPTSQKHKRAGQAAVGRRQWAGVRRQAAGRTCGERRVIVASLCLDSVLLFLRRLVFLEVVLISEKHALGAVDLLAATFLVLIRRAAAAEHAPGTSKSMPQT